MSVIVLQILETRVTKIRRYCLHVCVWGVMGYYIYIDISYSFMYYYYFHGGFVFLCHVVWFCLVLFFVFVVCLEDKYLYANILHRFLLCFTLTQISLPPDQMISATGTAALTLSWTPLLASVTPPTALLPGEPFVQSYASLQTVGGGGDNGHLTKHTIKVLNQLC